MSIFRAFAAAALLALAASTAQATTITTTKEAQKIYNAGSGSVNVPLATSGLTGKKIDGALTLDLSDVTYWADGWYDTSTGAPVGTASRGFTSRQEMTESIDSWRFTLSHAGTSVTFDNTATGRELFGRNSATFTTGAFDGLLAGGEWLLTATTDYWLARKRMIQFDALVSADLATVPSSGGGGQVPVPATLLLILSGMGLVARRRRSDRLFSKS